MLCGRMLGECGDDQRRHWQQCLPSLAWRRVFGVSAARRSHKRRLKVLLGFWNGRSHFLWPRAVKLGGRTVFCAEWWYTSWEGGQKAWKFSISVCFHIGEFSLRGRWCEIFRRFWSSANSRKSDRHSCFDAEKLKLQAEFAHLLDVPNYFEWLYLNLKTK